MKVMFSAEVMETNLMWEWCPGECGVESRVVGRGRIFCSQCRNFPKAPWQCKGIPEQPG